MKPARNDVQEDRRDGDSREAPGRSSTAVGLSLWDHMPVALAVEAVIAAAGLWLFLRRDGVVRGNAVGLAVLGAAVIAFTAVGMTVAPAPPSVATMAGSSLATLAVVSVLFVWLGRRARA
jgi:hypothetical protein